MNTAYLVALLTGAIFTLSILLTLLGLRLKRILSPNRPRPSAKTRSQKDQQNEAHLLIVLGSGGHTAEMIAMLTRALHPTSSDTSNKPLDWSKYKRRTWVLSGGDAISAQRAKEFEDMAALQSTQTEKETREGGMYEICVVPRARAIHQPLYTAPFSSLKCMASCFDVLTRYGYPDLILCNGPATATILVAASVLLRFLNWNRAHSAGKMRTVYVESWARVKKLSLSGMLLEKVVDRFLVQWPQLEIADGKREFRGVLV